MKTSQPTDPCTLRHIDPRSVDRNCMRLPAVRIESGWSIEIEGRWFRVDAEPQLLGDSMDDDGGRVQFLVTGPGVSVLDLVTFRRGERVWARPPKGTVPAGRITCDEPGDCEQPGPYTVTDDGWRCLTHLGDYILAEAAGPGSDGAAAADRG